MSKVSIIECRKYKKQDVEQAVSAAIDLLGGWQQFVKPDERIILKPNLLAKAEPDKACTTHPQVFAAVGSLLREKGYEHLSYGDSPGNHLMGLEKTAEGCGIKEKAEDLNIKAADFMRGTEIPFPQGETCRHFVLCNGVLEQDAIINICKMKTHMLERITGAVKNTFGCVYGFNKGASHAKFANAERFGKMLVDLNRLVKPRLHIMDGIVAMEGNGPQSGTPVPMHVIMASEDPVALDSIFCKLIHLDPQLVPTNAHGQMQGIGSYENIEVITTEGPITVEAAVDRWGDPDFEVQRDPNVKGELRSIRWLRPLLEKRPYIQADKCIGCGICVNSCPTEEKAIYFEHGKPVPRYQYKNCICCYCCQEMCPESAILVKKPWLVRFADRNWRI